LIVAIHQILYERNIYPPTTFITARKYGLPVQQIRHPDLCDYINHKTTAVHRAILSGTVKRISVVIFVQDLPREQFVFDITKLSQRRLAMAGKQTELEEHLPLVDAAEQLRAVLGKLRDHCVALEALDEQGTFRIVMDTDKDSALGAGDILEWKTIPKTGTVENCCSGEHALNNVKIWSVEAGALAFELWYETARTPPRPSSHTPNQSLASNRSASPPSSDMYGNFPLA
jgi:mitotic spindle assembly checkpoint protein MAD2B